jgi:glycosyltransferase involved in cell wall biosynthesis
MVPADDGAELSMLSPANRNQVSNLTVLIAVPTLESGAADHNALDLVRLLVKNGHRPIVVSSGGRLSDEVLAAGGEFVRMNVASRNPINMARCTRQLSRLIAQRQCHIVHALGRAPGWSAYLAARAQRKPFVTTWFKGFREQNRLKRLYNSVMVRGDRVIATSEDLADLIRDRYPAARDRLTMVPTEFDAGEFDPQTITQEQIDRVRHGWGALPRTRVILAPGRMVRRKGHDLIVQAAAQLKAAGIRDFLIVFTGEDQGRTHFTAELWDLVLATDTTDVIRIPGPGHALAEALAAATIAVFASTQNEGSPRTLLAAQAMSIPVVASDLAAGPDVMLVPPAVGEERMTGLRFAAGDSTALAMALIRLLSLSPKTRQEIGARGREWVSGYRTAGTIAEQTLRLYMELVQGNAST